ncbi:MAG: S-methyl-5-thioribose-1-phosphate isomerase [Acidobacteriota bacterium]
MADEVRPLFWNDGGLQVLDQRLLPYAVRHIQCSSPEDVAAAIKAMNVRGAPAIGVAAAFGMAMAIEETSKASEAGIRSRIDHAAALLLESRPTAVNLRWAVERMQSRAAALMASGGMDPARLRAQLISEAALILDEDIAGNRRIGQFGQQLLPSNSTVLTHCNAGALATAGYGTALGVVRAARDAGKHISVFADETRPFLQGARLTTWELQQEGIDVTLITDSTAGSFFQKGTFDAVIVGADRIAANGDTANKIGTFTLAVLADAHGVPFYVAAPWSTIDPRCKSGADIPIEERSAEEVTHTTGQDAEGTMHTVRTAPEGIHALHPAFDVTPARLITAIITDRGVLRPPFRISE